LNASARRAIVRFATLKLANKETRVTSHGKA
jgi:hypothetical protein